MPEFVTALLTAFGVVFVAELGDKTQLLAMNFGSRYPLRQVALGLTIGYAAAGLLAVVVGGLVGANLPDRQIEIVGGIVFVGFAIMTLRDVGDEQDEQDEADAVRSVVRSSIVATIGLTILVGEMGDKTQIATATLASRDNPMGTWVGATAGAVASGMIGATAGTLIGDRIPDAALRYAGAALFALFGILMLVGVF